jgi:hypothetical protein
MVQQYLSKKLSSALKERINSSIEMAGSKHNSKTQEILKKKPQRPKKIENEDENGFVNAD